MKSRVLSRRELVGGGLAAVAAAGGLGLLRPGAASAQGSADLGVMLDAVRLEQALSVAYAAMALRAPLGRALRRLLGELADHEHQHAMALLTQAEYLGGLPPAPPSLVEVEAKLPAVRTAVDRPSGLAALDGLEHAEVLGFYSYIQVLSDAKLIETVGAVMCSDSQHLVLVREAAGRDPIPGPYETGMAR